MTLKKNCYKNEKGMPVIRQQIFTQELIETYGNFNKWNQTWHLKEFPLDVSIYNAMGFKKFIDYYTNLVRNMSPRARFTYEKAGIQSKSLLIFI